MELSCDSTLSHGISRPVMEIGQGVYCNSKLKIYWSSRQGLVRRRLEPGSNPRLGTAGIVCSLRLPRAENGSSRGTSTIGRITGGKRILFFFVFT